VAKMLDGATRVVENRRIPMSIFARLGLATSFSLSVFPQFPSAFSCNQVTADAPYLRAGGNAERIGDIVLTCTGGTAGTTVGASIDVNTSYDLGGRTLHDGIRTDAFLFVDDPANPVLGVNAFQGSARSSNSTRFTFSAPIPGPNGSLRLRIANIRISVPSDVPTNLLVPNRALAFVSNTTNPFPINNPEQIVGFVAPGYTSQLLDAQDLVVPGVRFDSPGGGITQLRILEGFQDALKRRNVATSVATPSATADQPLYGYPYGTESGFYLSSFPSSLGANIAGLADSGTRIRAVISNVPAGVQLSASSTQIGASTNSISARLISTDGQGSGAFSLIAAGPDGYAPITVTAGLATAVWEVLESDPTVLEQLRFGIRTTHNSAVAGMAVVSADLAPFNPTQQLGRLASVPVFRGQLSSGTPNCTSNCISIPSAITFNATVGGPNPAPITIPIASTGANVSYQVSAASGHYIDIAPRDGAWLSVTPSQGITPGASPRPFPRRA